VQASSREGDRQAPQQTPPVETRWPGLQFLVNALVRWIVAVGIGIVLGFLGALYLWLPKISVSSSDPIDTSDPSLSYFVVSNDGYSPLHDLTVRPGVKYVYYDKIHLLGSDAYKVEFCGDESVGELGPWEKHSVALPLPTFGQSPLIDADITVTVYYRPSYWPWRRRSLFRFVTRKKADGHLYWLPEALSSHLPGHPPN
jgi:hypothetical protein